MITDNQTNKLFLSDLLPDRHPKFFKEIEGLLSKYKIDVEFLPNTKDIWAVDYMPVQISKDKFVQFTYKPDYLMETKKLRETISDVDSVCKAINLTTIKSNLIVDGGNVSKTTDKVIMCDKVFHENKHISERDLIKELKELFEVDKLYFVPWDTDDFTGHSDGMVRFINKDTVLINDYSKQDGAFQRCFRMSLHNAGLDWVEIPYNPPYDDPELISAKGLYINYLQMEQAVIMPTFKSKFDDKAYRVLEEVFKGQTIATIDGNEVAKEGGILNCITWNIKKVIKSN
jgi:agmatine deiminase